MASETRVICDVCGKETRGFQDDSFNKEVAKNNWDVSISSMWMENHGDTDLLRMEKEHQVRADVCFECAKHLGIILKAAMIARGSAS